MRTKVALIFGGRSLESDISVITAMQALAVLKELEYEVEPFYLCDGDFYMKDVDRIDAFIPFCKEKHLKTVLVDGSFCSVRKNRLKREFRPDAAFICCHGGEGENGVLQGLLDFNGVAYCSSGVLGSAVGMDKAAAKGIFEQMLLNVLPHVVVFSEDFERDAAAEAERAESFLRYPMIVKPAAQGSSIGIRAAADREELIDAMAVAAEFDDKLLVEEKLTDFAEVNCAAYGRGGKVVVSQTERPLAAGDLLTFEDKYMADGKMSGGGHVIPADVGEINDVVRSVTERVYRAMELRGIVRVDFLVDKTRGKVYVNEVNTVPGSLAFYLFEPLGVSFSQLISDQIEEALERKRKGGKRKVYRTPVLELYGRGAKGAKHGK